jgi:hypothetical protein
VPPPSSGRGARGRTDPILERRRAHVERSPLPPPRQAASDQSSPARTCARRRSRSRVRPNRPCCGRRQGRLALPVRARLSLNCPSCRFLPVRCRFCCRLVRSGRVEQTSQPCAFRGPSSRHHFRFERPRARPGARALNPGQAAFSRFGFAHARAQRDAARRKTSQSLLPRASAVQADVASKSARATKCVAPAL